MTSSFKDVVKLTGNENRREVIECLKYYNDNDLYNIYCEANCYGAGFCFAYVFDNLEDVYERCGFTEEELSFKIANGNIVDVNAMLHLDKNENLENVTEDMMYQYCRNNIEELADWIMKEL